MPPPLKVRPLSPEPLPKVIKLYVPGKSDVPDNWFSPMIAPPGLTVTLPAAMVSTLLLPRLKFSRAGEPELPPTAMLPLRVSVLGLASAVLKAKAPCPRSRCR